jgi:PAS domain S-box-containing protein
VTEKEPNYEKLQKRIERLEKETSDLKRHNEALASTVAELNAIYDTLRVGIAVVNMEGRVVKINKSLVKLGGYPEEEIIGKHFQQLHMFTPASISKMLYSFTRIVEDKEAPHFEVEFYTKTGEKKVLEVYSALFEKGGDVDGVLVVMKDITYRKYTEERGL